MYGTSHSNYFDSEQSSFSTMPKHVNDSTDSDDIDSTGGKLGKSRVTRRSKGKLSNPADGEEESIHLRNRIDSLDANSTACEADASLSFRSGKEPKSQTMAKTTWHNALAELALNIPPATFDTWMRDTQVIGYEDGEFIIGVPNAYAVDWLKNRLRTEIKRTLARLLNRSVDVKFRVVPPLVSEHPNARPVPLYDGAGNSDVGTDGKLVSEDHSTANSSAEDAYPHGSIGSVSDAALQNQGTPHHVNGQHPSDKSVLTGSIALNAYHTFDTFVVGNHNRIAHAAATAIADKPGASFNPLFVYGGVGLGKTHLLHAIGNEALNNGYRILYCTSEQFTNELISSIRGQSTEAFRNKYRRVDILLIDDIQFIGGKESTQEEFFHTFNHIHATGGQVVLSSDRPPKALATLEERLRSRFEGGLQTDIAKADFETRVAILQSKALKADMHVDQAVLMLIAERVDSNIRELEGALNRILMHARLFSSKLDIPLAESVLKNLAPERTLRTPDLIVKTVAEYFRLESEDLIGKSRTKDIAHARQVSMYILREENAMSLPSIGSMLGGRDHSTIRHGIEKISKAIDNDETVRRQIMALREKIYAAPSIDG